MRTLLTPLLQLQRFFIPALLVLLLWAIWKLVFRKDRAIGLALYACLVVVVDGFYNTGIYLPGLAQGSIRYSEVCALFLLLQPGAGPPDESSRRGVVFLASAYFSMMVISALRAEPMIDGIMEFRKIMFPQIVAFLVASRGLETPIDYRRFLLCLNVLAILVGAFCLWDVFFDRTILHSDMLFKAEYYHNRKLGRFGSIFLNPNFLGAFVVLTCPPLLALLITEQGRLTRGYLLAGLLLLIFCLVQTQSRAPLAAFAGTIALFIVGPVGGLSRSRRFAAVAVAAVFFALAIPGFLEHATQRFSTLGTEESEEDVSRASTWRYTRRLIAATPWFGVGFGESQFKSAMAATDFQERYGRPSLDNPHNSYLQAAIYAGIPALALLALTNLLLLSKSWRASRRSSTEGHFTTEIFGLSVGIVGFLVCSYPDMHLFTPSLAPVYWLFAGLLLSFLAKLPGEVAPQSGRGRLPMARGTGRKLVTQKPSTNSGLTKTSRGRAPTRSIGQ